MNGNAVTGTFANVNGELALTFCDKFVTYYLVKN